jgi:hypothetical protein
MKAKTLLIAAAALAAGVISSQAQTPVYSQNIVGYVNVVYTNGVNSLTANPFINGTNGGSQVFSSGLPDGTQIFQWNGVSAFNVYTYDAGLASSLGVSSPWFNGDETAVSPAPTAAPGGGFFLLPTATFTNTYVGSVAAPVGGSVTNSFVNGAQTLAASLVPYSGSLTNAAINFAPPDGTQIFLWNGINGFNVSTYDTGLAASLGVASPWFNGDETAVAPAPVVSVAQGYFILTTGNYNWVQSL